MGWSPKERKRVKSYEELVVAWELWHRWNWPPIPGEEEEDKKRRRRGGRTRKVLSNTKRKTHLLFRKRQLCPFSPLVNLFSLSARMLHFLFIPLLESFFVWESDFSYATSSFCFYNYWKVHWAPKFCGCLEWCWVHCPFYLLLSIPLRAVAFGNTSARGNKRKKKRKKEQKTKEAFCLTIFLFVKPCPVSVPNMCEGCAPTMSGGTAKYDMPVLCLACVRTKPCMYQCWTGLGSMSDKSRTPPQQPLGGCPCFTDVRVWVYTRTLTLLN